MSRPPFIKSVRELPDNGGTVWHWTGSDEVLGVRTALSRPLGLVRVGVHHDLLRPGERSSLPHAEPWEEECVYVLEGRPDAWIDGALHPLQPDDIAVFAPGTGVRHSILNRTRDPVRLLVVGERLDTAQRAARGLVELWNERDPARVEALFAAECRYVDVPAGTSGEGRAEVRRLVDARLAAHPDLRLEPGELVASADRLALEWSATRTEGGHPIALRGVWLALLEGAAITRLTEIYSVETSSTATP